MISLSADKITKEVTKLCIGINCNIGSDVIRAIRKALKSETSPIGRDVLGQILKNDSIAARDNTAACQDTGIVIVFVRLGQDLRITGGSLSDAINEGVRQGYKKGYLRKSVVNDPLERTNTGDNTPAVIHTEIVSGKKLELTLMAKGAGSENMSAVRMLSPSDGENGVKKFIVDTVRNAGANPCPPIVVGVGIGGTAESASLIAKKALLRPLNTRNKNRRYAAMERELLKQINNLGIGPQGFGGRMTALAVHIETMSCHIASLPVAVNINCHAARHGSVILPLGRIK